MYYRTQDPWYPGRLHRLNDVLRHHQRSLVAPYNHITIPPEVSAMLSALALGLLALLLVLRLPLSMKE
jgi:hypothetical protein